MVSNQDLSYDKYTEYDVQQLEDGIAWFYMQSFFWYGRAATVYATSTLMRL